MRKFNLMAGIASALIATVCLSSCQKEETLQIQEEEAAVQAEASSSTTYSAAEFASLFGDAVPETKCTIDDVYTVEVLTYKSTGADGKEIELSMKIAYPEGLLIPRYINYIVLDNHPTICSDAEAPSNGVPYALAKAMDNALVVCPDYEGYGVTKDHAHPYLCHDVNAKQSVDAVLAAIDRIAGVKKAKLKKGYYLFNSGYSQGGGIALAVHKYIESLPASVQSKLNLKESLCGGGPYSPVITFDEYKSSESLAYPTVAAMQMIGYKARYPEVLKNFALEDFFTDAFLASGVLDIIDAKNTIIEDINAVISEKLGTTDPRAIFVEDMSDVDSEMSKALMICLEDNDLTTGWAPKAKVTLFHSEGDDVVPFANAQAAYDSLSAAGGNVVLDKAIASPTHVYTGILYYAKYLKLLLPAGIVNNLVSSN